MSSSGRDAGEPWLRSSFFLFTSRAALEQHWRIPEQHDLPLLADDLWDESFVGPRAEGCFPTAGLLCFAFLHLLTLETVDVEVM